MSKTLADVSLCDQYKQISCFSSPKDKDRLIINILGDSTDYFSKEEQVNDVFGDWVNLQNQKAKYPYSKAWYTIELAVALKQLDKNNIVIGVRALSDKYEYWVVCEEKDYELLDRIYDVYVEYAGVLSKPVDFIFISEEQFVGKDNISFIYKF